MKREEVESRNTQFLMGAVRTLATKNAQFALAIGVAETNELMICSNNLLTDKQIYDILMEAARAIQAKGGGIITLT